MSAWPLGVAVAAFADSGSPPRPPTLDPPSIARDAAASRYRSGPAAFGPYSHGEPSAQEQYMLELVNRARANPPAEGWRLQATTDPDILNAYSYFQVDLARLVADFAGYPARPPLAFNANLIAAARGHSQDMADQQFSGSYGQQRLHAVQPDRCRRLHRLERPCGECLRLCRGRLLRPCGLQRGLGSAKPRPPPEHHEFFGRRPRLHRDRHRHCRRGFPEHCGRPADRHRGFRPAQRPATSWSGSSTATSTTTASTASARVSAASR